MLSLKDNRDHKNTDVYEYLFLLSLLSYLLLWKFQNNQLVCRLDGEGLRVFAARPNNQNIFHPSSIDRQ